MHARPTGQAWTDAGMEVIQYVLIGNSFMDALIWAGVVPLFADCYRNVPYRNDNRDAKSL